ncbi:energy transducer TonB [Chitinivibrio alkaliphilus]|uniref:TonB protein n=1 Tax=Chitinivibrio alkaliphilus ACht1 TaxID=1313304 RepID=U7D5S9_9BACT|nr:energy transducer protein TonB [Chitinivibrio alkaliphilus]ERP31849.1 TonB protein [Chitinivibrio alkaliphilus ACht1]
MSQIPPGFHVSENGGISDPFRLILLCSIILGVLVALFFQGISLPEFEERPQEESIQFFYTEELSFEEEPEKDAAEEIVDISEEPPTEDVSPYDAVEEVSEVSQKTEVQITEELDEPSEDVEEESSRRVFGVEQVYSEGLGSGGDTEDAVVGRRGNILNKTYDTIQAEDSDLRGPLVSAALVSRAPSFRRRVPPVATDEMRKEGVEGVISVRVLVDADGSVRQAVPQNDLGYGSREAALEAVLQMEFEPAQR